MEFAHCFLILLGVVFSGNSVWSSETPSLHVSFERYVEMMKTINASPLLRKEWEKHISLTREDPVVSSLRTLGAGRAAYQVQCSGQYRSEARPNSVHQLKVGDIDVISSMGDSLTAGNGVLAWTILGCLTEYRGRSWSIGGDRTVSDGVTTLSNIMKLFNPQLKGFSVGSGDANSRGAGMNVAVAGAIAQDMPSQAVNLVQKMRNDPEVDFENDWKMVTVFIGGNNLCAFCDDLEKHSAETYIGYIAEALDYLQTNLPRTFVNLVEIFDIAPVAQLGNGLICNLVHSAVCSCGHGDHADTDGLTRLSREYQKVVSDLVQSGRYDTKEDFTVVLQPFFRETSPPSINESPDMSYFAPDCFHFSGKGQNAAGKALWNTILQPTLDKNTDWRLDESIRCPSTEFIPTKHN